MGASPSAGHRAPPGSAPITVPITVPTTVPISAQIAGWSPAPETRTDPMAPGPASALHALLGGARPRSDLPPLWHWVYFTQWPPMTELGTDGHPRTGGLLPPLADRRRVFAGGRVTWHSPLRLGDVAEQRAELARCALKRGRTGAMLLVTIRSTIRQDGRLVIAEEQDLIYRSGPPDVPPALREPDTTTMHESRGGAVFAPDPVALFRFSALTANSHRIHYDLPYAREREGYPGLPVHGPYQALALAEQVRARGRQAGEVAYRMRAPLFAGEHARISMRETPGGAQLALTGPDGTVRASATAVFLPARTSDSAETPGE